MTRQIYRTTVFFFVFLLSYPSFAVSKDKTRNTSRNNKGEFSSKEQFLLEMYSLFYSLYSSEIMANLSRSQKNLLRRYENSNPTRYIAFQKLFTFDLFDSILKTAERKDGELLQQAGKLGRTGTANKLRQEAIETFLKNERTRLVSEAVDPRKKWKRFQEWETLDKRARKAAYGRQDVPLYYALGQAATALQSPDFNPSLIHEFAAYLQRIKNIHNDTVLPETEKNDLYQQIRQEMIALTQVISAQKPPKDYQEQRIEKIEEEISALYENRIRVEISIDPDVIHLIADLLTNQIRFPNLSIRSIFKTKRYSQWTSDQLDYLRRRIKLVFSPDMPSDYEADYFKIFSQEKNFYSEETLGRFVYLPEDTFLMGSPETEEHHKPVETQHQVTLSAFEIMDTAVSQHTYATIMAENPSYFKKKKHCKNTFTKVTVRGNTIRICPDFPVDSVSYIDAKKFIQVLNRTFLDSYFRYRLPTEAEAEYSIRGGEKAAFVCGPEPDYLEEYMDFEMDSSYSIKEKRKRPNNFRVFRSGLWEWTQDWIGVYPEEHQINPIGSRTGTQARKVLRGGSYMSSVDACRSAYRAYKKVDGRSRDVGFRLVRVIKNRYLERENIQ